MEFLCLFESDQVCLSILTSSLNTWPLTIIAKIVPDVCLNVFDQSSNFGDNISFGEKRHKSREWWPQKPKKGQQQSRSHDVTKDLFELFPLHNFAQFCSNFMADYFNSCIPPSQRNFKCISVGVGLIRSISNNIILVFKHKIDHLNLPGSKLDRK